MKMKKSVIMAVCAVFAHAGYANVVITFDGAAANASTLQLNLGTTGAQTLGAGQTYNNSLAYSTTAAKWSSGSPANYSGQSIYGGQYMLWTNSSASSVTVPSANLLVYRGDLSPENVSVASYVTNTAAIGRKLNFALLFGLNAAGNYGFDANSVLTATVKSSANSGGTADNRWVVVAGGVTYVAESTLGNFTTSYVTNTLNNPDEINWAVWNPGADMSFGSLAYNVAGSSITNITLTGIAANQAQDAGTGNRVNYLAGFTGDLSVIPEPATIGLLGLGALVAIVLRRKL